MKYCQECGQDFDEKDLDAECHCASCAEELSEDDELEFAGDDPDPEDTALADRLNKTGMEEAE